MTAGQRAGRGSSFLAALVLAACAERPPEIIAPSPETALRSRAIVAEDTAPKEDLRMMPPEAYMRTYLRLFGGLSPLEAQRRARGADGGSLFDTWDDYVSALGFPDYRLDIPRQAQTNALMIATFERLGVALCDRALEHDLKSETAVPVAARLIFAFEAPRGSVDAAAFASRFDVLHRTFLGYPAALAPPQRTERFFRLYRDVLADHAKDSPKARFTPVESAWAAVCYGLVRHPEFHLY